MESGRHKAVARPFGRPSSIRVLPASFLQKARARIAVIDKGGRSADQADADLPHCARRSVSGSAPDLRLTILLGNHDIELSYPRVRSALERVLGTEEGRGFRFVYDGEAYVERAR